MKIRTGFVSNSSASSFCIYGWNEYDLNMKVTEANYLFDELKTKYPKINFVKIYGPAGDSIFGVGNIDDEFDHYTDDWQSYEALPPSDNEMKDLNRVAELERMPFPYWHSATWFNG